MPESEYDVIEFKAAIDMSTFDSDNQMLQFLKAIILNFDAWKDECKEKALLFLRDEIDEEEYRDHLEACVTMSRDDFIRLLYNLPPNRYECRTIQTIMRYRPEDVTIKEILAIAPQLGIEGQLHLIYGD